MYSTGYSTVSKLVVEDVARAYARPYLRDDGKPAVWYHRNASMTVECTGSPPKPRVLSTLAPIGNDVHFGCHLPDVMTACRALLERVFFVQHGNEFRITPEPVRGVFLSPGFRKFRKLVTNNLLRAQRISASEYAAMFTGKKRKTYARAVESLALRAISEKDARLKHFVKCEKINRTAKLDPAPRIISPRDPRYNVELGRFLKPIEHLIYEAINDYFGSVVVAKGLNGAQRGELLASKWARFKKPVAISLDAKRFDQHVSEDILKFEHSFYKRIYRTHPEFAELLMLLGWQLSNIGYVNCSDGKIQITIDGGRCSGDVNTALGNVICMCAMVADYMSDPARRNMMFDLLDDGDDLVLIVEECDLHRLDDLEEKFLRYGFEMEREAPVRVLEHIDFCQCHPVLVGDKYRMVRNPNTAVAKDLIVTRHFLHERDWNNHRNAVSQCGEALAGDVPIFTSFYQTLRRGIDNKKRGKHGKYSDAFTGEEWLGLVIASKGMKVKFCEPAAVTRCSFFLAFGITPDHQVAVEREYDKISLHWRDRGPPVHHFPVRSEFRW